MKVFVTRAIPEAGLRVLREGGAEVVVGQRVEEEGISREALLAGASGADAPLSLLTERVDGALLEACPTLRGVANYAVGHDNLDVPATRHMVDEAVLVRALREGWIAGAALDVYEHEPAPPAGLAELENVVLAPHIGSASRDTRDRMAVMAARNALHHLRKERAQDVVNPEVYEQPAWRRRTGRGP